MNNFCFTAEDIDIVFARFVKAHPKYSSAIEELLRGLISYAQMKKVLDNSNKIDLDKTSIKILSGNELYEEMLECFMSEYYENKIE